MLKLGMLWIVVLLSTSSARAQVSGVPSEPAVPGTPSAPLSMSLVSSIAYDELYEACKKIPVFASMDKDKPGSPITIRVSHSYGHTSAGTASAIASAILAGGTLGLLPAFSNRDLVITYDVLVNETLVSSYSYSKNVTRVFNIHSTDKTHGLGADGLAWVTGTAPEFAADLERDPAYARIQAEYRYYYASAPIAAVNQPPR
jgi:hypothetical protein